MNNYKSTKVSFGNGSAPVNIQPQNSKAWRPDTQELSPYSSSFFSDMTESSTNRFYKDTSMKNIDNNKRTCPKALLISVGVPLSVVVLAALTINIYLLIYINNTTTTTTSTTPTTSKACVTGDTSITFDNLTVSLAVPNGYYDILWSNAYVYTQAVNGNGYYTDIVSSPNIIYNGGGAPMSMTSGTGRFFSIYSAAMTAAWLDNLQLTVVGYKSNVVIRNNTFTLQVFTVSHLTFTGYTALDTIVFTSYGGTQNPIANGSGMHFAMDNICLSFV